MPKGGKMRYEATIAVQSQTETTATYAAELTKGKGPLWVSQSAYDADDNRLALEHQPVVGGVATLAIGGTFPDGHGGTWELDPAYCVAYAFVWPNIDLSVSDSVKVTP